MLMENSISKSSITMATNQPECGIESRGLGRDNGSSSQMEVDLSEGSRKLSELTTAVDDCALKCELLSLEGFHEKCSHMKKIGVQNSWKP